MESMAHGRVSLAKGDLVSSNRQQFVVDRRLPGSGNQDSYKAIGESDGRGYHIRIDYGQNIVPSKLRKLGRAPSLAGYLPTGDVTIHGPGGDIHVEAKHIMVREWAPKTLKNTIATIGQPDLARPAIESLISGLTILHKHNIVHGSINPANILVNSDLTVSHADFGQHGNARIPRGNFGAFKYSAPEILTPNSRTTKQSDVYALGAVMRDLLGNENSSSDVRAHQLVWIAEECLQWQPGDRPTIEQVAAYIDELSSPDRISWRFRLKDMRPALIASLCNRVPGMANAPIGQLNRALAEAETVLSQAHRTARLVLLSHAEIIHLVSTVILTRGSLHQEAYLRPSNIAIMIDIMNFSGETFGHDDDPWIAQFEKAYLPLTPEEAAEFAEKYSYMAKRDLDRILRIETPEFTEARARTREMASKVREQLLSATEYVGTEDVAAIMSHSCPGITAAEVRILRDFDILLAVPYAGRHRYPLFQFEKRTGLPSHAIKYASERLSTYPDYWEVLSWWLTPSRYTNGKAPYKLLTKKHPDSDRATAAVDALLAS